MTGYGKGVAESSNRKIVVELKAVNNKGLDIVIKLNRSMSFCEVPIRQILIKSLLRGHIDVYVTYEDNRNNKSKIICDENIALQYRTIAKKLESLGFVDDMTASQVMKMPEVLTSKDEEDDEQIVSELINKATTLACEALVVMRSCEGQMLYEDVNQRFDNLEFIANKIKNRAPIISEVYKEKLTDRIKESLEQVEIDENKLINEVAFFIDKSNIDEEIARLFGHINHGKEIMDKEGAIGSSLDFLGQELMREANTTGSKSNDFELTGYVLDAKNEIKKIREQIQNIE